VYQQGWRLGGKGASGRGKHDRIEEHGLHLWMGFYENAFRVMRECYAELDRDPKVSRIARWTDAFKPDNFCGAADLSPEGEWSVWKAHFPPMPGLPGDGEPLRWSVADYLSRSVRLVLTVLQAIRESDAGTKSSEDAFPPAGVTAGDVIPMITRLMRYGELTSLAALIQSMRLLDTVAMALPSYPRDLVLQFHGAIAEAARSQLQARSDESPELRRLWEIVDLVLAVIRGIIRFNLLTHPRGFEAIDDYDCREWLRLNGASDRACDSAFLRALYDLAFAYEEGDVSCPRIAAGQALRGAVRAFFTYRGAFFWKMQSGMGDVVFAPLFEVLKKRGVAFEFFHRLKQVRLVETELLKPQERPYVKRLEFEVQAHVLDGTEYRPLIDVRGLPCWPAA
jgi:uncharacterized protein with NAD-binding domain and iron-sulfur cluster